jgi:hypothetical protein
MANKNYAPKGFQPRNSGQSTPPVEPIQTSTRTVVQAALTSSAAHLQQLEEGMDLVADQFADRAVEIVKGGIQNCYVKASERIAEIEVEDFFELEEVGSMFGSMLLPSVTVEVLPAGIDAA